MPKLEGNIPVPQPMYVTFQELQDSKKVQNMTVGQIQEQILQNWKYWLQKMPVVFNPVCKCDAT